MLLILPRIRSVYPAICNLFPLRTRRLDSTIRHELFILPGPNLPVPLARILKLSDATGPQWRVAMKIARWMVGGWLAGLMLTGCAPWMSVDVEPLELTIGSATPAAHTAAIAMAAMAGDMAHCARVIEACDGQYPCMGEVEVELGPACPLPLGADGEGLVTVQGTWHAEDEATLAASFTNVDVGGRALVVVEASNLVAHWSPRGDGRAWVAFSDSDVEVSAWSGVTVGSSDWHVEIDLAGTPDEPLDDVYVLDGSASVVHNTTVRDISLERVVITRQCGLNPISGHGEMVDVGILNVSVVGLSFHEECDGMVDVDSAGSHGSVSLDLLD